MKTDKRKKMILDSITVMRSNFQNILNAIRLHDKETELDTDIINLIKEVPRLQAHTASTNDLMMTYNLLTQAYMDAQPEHRESIEELWNKLEQSIYMVGVNFKVILGDDYNKAPHETELDYFEDMLCSFDPVGYVAEILKDRSHIVYGVNRTNHPDGELLFQSKRYTIYRPEHGSKYYNVYTDKGTYRIYVKKDEIKEEFCTKIYTPRANLADLIALLTMFLQ